ncbi:2-C-methyl-D-erythritol 2,4-cyclodiphosphate synthase [Planctomycetota bacterium]
MTANENKTPSCYRVGQGYDLHRLVEGRKLILGGVEIACDRGLIGHSDGDVVLHAVIDALLGGAGLGDIGEQFGDTDPAYKDVDSGVLLSEVLEKVRSAGFAPVNVDTTIIAEKPKLSDYKPALRRRLAQLLNLDESAVGVKAKTNEGLGEIGAGEAIACCAVTLLTNINDT